MAHGCIGMSDNAPTTLASTALLVERVREMVEEDFSEDELVRMLRVGCFPRYSDAVL
jgi:hypothetical protein